MMHLYSVAAHAFFDRPGEHADAMLETFLYRIEINPDAKS